MLPRAALLIIPFNYLLFRRKRKTKPSNRFYQQLISTNCFRKKKTRRGLMEVEAEIAGHAEAAGVQPF